VSVHTHVVAVSGDVEGFGELISHLGDLGLRCGWLEWREPGLVDQSLGMAVDMGAFRAVAVGEERTVAVKRMKGPAVLRDVVREYFKGCAVVLVVGGPPGLPMLRAKGDGWELRGVDGEVRSLGLEALGGRLRGPTIV